MRNREHFDMEQNFEALRKEFPVLQRKTYLNSGSYCALANEVRAAFNAYMEDRLLVGANWDVWVTKNESVRNLTATLLRATPDEIAVTASVSAGLNALASALQFTGPRNKVVVSDFEFPTNAQIWHAQEPRGARVVHVPRAADGYIPAEMFEKAIDEETQLVAITHVCFRNGAKLDIPGIVRIARAKGAKVLLDCYQSVGSLDIDVKALDVDFAVGGMLKYLLGTAGIGFMYAKDSCVRSLLPTNSGWFAQANITAMDITANRPAPNARRFEAGTPPVVNCYAAEAGLKMLLRVGTGAITKRNYALTRRCMQRLEEIGWPSITPKEDERRGATVAVPSRDSARLSAELMKHDIVTSYRDDNVRASFHFYNNEDDVESFIAAMQEMRDSLAPRLMRNAKTGS
ncbi:MAG TPA: aminotransferase class V-fold PLP-dependent enzyme [Steroidobacteraceae bacterium]|jgi:selenocysteine lyase/cysteine desulfurase|nr:aminotransferase class V-fold PLP-dependent enzyme [Steroidobacteraceae bacterium]